MKTKRKDQITVIYYPTLNLPVANWRIENYARQLIKLRTGKYKVGVFVDYLDDLIHVEQAWDSVIMIDDDVTREVRGRVEAGFRTGDIVVFQKIQEHQGLLFIKEMKEKYPDVKVIAEIDDHIGDVTPSNINIEKFKHQHDCAAYHCLISDGVICSTEYLADSVKRFNQNTYVAPNCIDNEFWDQDPKNKLKKTGITCGYVAAGGHDEDLEIIYDAILPVLEKNPELTWVVRYGSIRPDFFKRHKQIDFESVSWFYEEYPAKLKSLDLDFAVAPLRDTEFNRCKSNIKWLEMAQIGVPLIASNVEPFKKTKGFIELVENSEESWREAIQKMVDLRKNKKDFQGLKRTVRKDCRENYNLKKNAKKLLIWFRNMLQ